MLTDAEEEEALLTDASKESGDTGGDRGARSDAGGGAKDDGGEQVSKERDI